MSNPSKSVIAILVALMFITIIPASMISADGDDEGEESSEVEIDFSEIPTIGTPSPIEFTYTGAKITIYLYNYSIEFSNYQSAYPDMRTDVKEKISFEWYSGETLLPIEESFIGTGDSYLLGPYAVGDYTLRMTYYDDTNDITVSKDTSISIVTQEFELIDERSEFVRWGQIQNGFGIDYVSYNYAIIAKIPRVGEEEEIVYDYYAMGYDLTNYPEDVATKRFEAIPVTIDANGRITLDVDGRHALTFSPDTTTYYIPDSEQTVENRLWEFGTGVWGSGTMVLSGKNLGLGAYNSKEFGIVIRFGGEEFNSSDDGSVIVYNVGSGHSNALHLVKGDDGKVFFSGDGDDETEGYDVYPIYLYREYYEPASAEYAYDGPSLDKQYDGEPVIVPFGTISTPDGPLENVIEKNDMLKLRYSCDDDTQEFVLNPEMKGFVGPSAVGDYVMTLAIVNEKIPGDVTVVLEGTFRIYESDAGCKHDFEVKYNEPTCTEDGSYDYTCKNCSYSYSEPIPRLGHDLGTPVTDDSHTHTSVCNRCGAEVTEDHLFDNGDRKTVDDRTVMRYTCDLCGYSYDVDIFTVTFVVNGGSECSPIEAMDGESKDLPSSVRNGYEFVGWYTDAGLTNSAGTSVTVTSDITLYAKWDCEVYAIQYILDLAGADNGENPDSYTVETDTITLKPARSDTAEFIGWTGLGEGYCTEIPKGTTGDLQLVAHWRFIYTVSFESNGGSECPSIEAKDGESKDLPSSERNGYEFAGWYTDAELTNSAGTSVTVTSDITLYAKWDCVVYTIEYVLGFERAVNGNNPYSYTIETDTITLVPALYDKTEFIGWTGLGEGYCTEIPKGTTGDLRLVAQWVPIYTVSFESNGGSECPPIEAMSGESKDLPSSERNGYEFAGWYTDAELTNSAGTSVTVTSDITLYAKWDCVVYTIEYILDLAGAENGANPDSYTVETDTIILKPAQYDSKKFMGWTGLGEGYCTEIPKGTTGDLQLVAQWADPCTITFESNGGSACDPVSVYPGYVPTLPNPSRTNYNFDGWFSDRGLTNAVERSAVFDGTSDVTYYAKWTYAIQDSCVSEDVIYGGDGSETSKTTTTIGNENGYIVIIEEIVRDNVGNVTSSNSSANADVPTTVVTDGNGGSVANVSGADVENLLNTISDKASEGVSVTITVDASSTGTVVLDESSVTNISSAGASVNVTFVDGSMDIPPDVLSSVNGQLSISMSSVDASELSESQRDAVAGGSVFAFSAESADGAVHELGGTVTITVAYTLPEGVDPDSIAAYYVDGDGNMEYIGGHYENGTFVFDTDHFSVYVIKEKVSDGSGGDGTPLIIGAIVGLVVIVGLVAVYFHRKA